jgi:hypothetical protein
MPWGEILRISTRPEVFLPGLRDLSGMLFDQHLHPPELVG